MKFAIIVLVAAAACVLAAPPAPAREEKDAEVLSFKSDIRPDGSFDFGYETSNGIVSHELAEVRQGRDEKNEALEFLARSGDFEWKDDQGQQHNIKWVADENGFRAEGSDVPK